MKNLKRIAAVAIAVAVLATVGSVFAAEFKRPVQIVSELTGKSIESLRAEKMDGNRYGDIAKKYEKQDEFMAQMLEQKKSVLDEKVQNGVLTQEQADKIYDSICSEDRQIHFGKEFSATFGKGLHMSEDGQRKNPNANMNFDGQGKRMYMSEDGQRKNNDANMDFDGQGRGSGRGMNR